MLTDDLVAAVPAPGLRHLAAMAGPDQALTVLVEHAFRSSLSEPGDPHLPHTPVGVTKVD
ncbi:hypothetical protein O4220_20835 [Rhodococcus ruber]|uniref:Uncharacterized protein n=1 Tax=Rhodococcus ruber TaxID=1830 RepID=A0ABT4MJ04_9NOCA|nr:hypothetical protein [Rhodococcus ruber]MCZ4520964.1 hypothetical protein [Rhodococcus ruber]